MTRLLAFSVILLLAGCATNQSMSAEQINAAVKDKSVSVVCAKIMGAWGTAETTVVTFDQRVISNGGVSVGDKCAVAVTDAKIVPVPKAP